MLNVTFQNDKYVHSNKNKQIKNTKESLGIEVDVHSFNCLSGIDEQIGKRFIYMIIKTKSSLRVIKSYTSWIIFPREDFNGWVLFKCM